jgi:hypothetical protein
MLLRTLRQCNNAWVHYEIVASRDEEIFFHIGVDRPLWQRSPRIVQLYREVLARHLVKLLRGAKPANSQGDWCRCVFVVHATRRQGDRMTMLFATVHESVHGAFETCRPCDECRFSGEKRK